MGTGTNGRLDMRTAGWAVLLLAAAATACERRADVPPAQPTEGVAGTQVQEPQPGVAAGAPQDTIDVQLQGRDGQPAGVARLVHRDDGVEVHIRVSGLTPNQEHGFHVHETGTCETPGFQSAGGHFAPHGRQHGFQNPQGPHAGDLPNLRANAQGSVDTMVVAQNIRVRAAGPESVIREQGAALVVHANPDDYRTDPSGNSGDRIMCGVVRPR
jgi:superoxide dismutase, Cu-Zn family